MNLEQISQQQFIREAHAMSEMMAYLDGFNIDYDKIMLDACNMVAKARDSKHNLSVEGFLNKYNLSTKEGVALMCLAESLLRVPDQETADELIESTFKGTDWKQYIKKDDAFYFNATSWAMLLTGKSLEFGDSQKEQGAGVLRNVFRQGKRVC